MPPKAKPAKAAKAELGITIQGYCDAMKGVSIMVRTEDSVSRVCPHDALCIGMLPPHSIPSHQNLRRMS